MVSQHLSSTACFWHATDKHCSVSDEQRALLWQAERTQVGPLCFMDTFYGIWKDRSLSWLPSKNTWKTLMHILRPNQWTEAADPCCWIKERLEEAEKDYPIGRPAVSNNLDPQNFSDTELPTRQHRLADMRPRHTGSIGLPGMASVRGGAPNPLETWGPRMWGGLVVWGLRGGAILLNSREEEWDEEQLEGRLGMG